MERSFKKFVVLKEGDSSSSSRSSSSSSGGGGGSDTEWKKDFKNLEKGFVPPPNMRPIIDAFLDSGNIEVMADVSKPVKMPKKSLYLVGGPVRDFLKGKTPKDMDLATNATPEQAAHILHAAGFKTKSKRNAMGKSEPDFDVSGKKGLPMKLGFEAEIGSPGDNMYWYLKGRDASQDGKPFVLGAVVNGEEFDLATFRKDAKVVDGEAEVNFVDNPTEDASRRDLTINAMYIELTKSEGENNKLYDPTGQGYHDIMQGQVRTVGPAEDRFREDKLRVMRAIRFHCRFGKGSKMHKDIEKALPKFKNLGGVANERIRDEFLKGLLHPDVDPKAYLNIYYRTGLVEKVFPGVEVHLQVPSQLRDRRDKPFALAWILQNNPVEKVAAVLGSKRRSGEEDVQTGWTNTERSGVLFLLALKEFDAEKIDDLMDKKKQSGLTDDQIRDWADMFNITDKLGRTISSRPDWSVQVKGFADFKPDSRDTITWHSKGEDGKSTGEIHPEIQAGGFAGVHPTQRGQVVKGMNRDKLNAAFKDSMPKNENLGES